MPVMAMLLHDAFAVTRAELRPRSTLIWEIVALRHQLTVLKRTGTRRPRIRFSDRLLWTLLSRCWPDWRESLIIVQPETVLRWRRRRLSLIWGFGSHGRWRGGCPRIASEVRHLIVRMARENFLWGAPRVHGELLKLGFDVSQATVSRYMPRRGARPSQTWQTFLRNQTAAMRLAELRDMRRRACNFSPRALACWRNSMLRLVRLIQMGLGGASRRFVAALRTSGPSRMCSAAGPATRRAIPNASPSATICRRSWTSRDGRDRLLGSRRTPPYQARASPRLGSLRFGTSRDPLAFGDFIIAPSDGENRSGHLSSATGRIENPLTHRQGSPYDRRAIYQSTHGSGFEEGQVPACESAPNGDPAEFCATMFIGQEKYTHGRVPTGADPDSSREPTLPVRSGL
jgi:hypothetical protein